LKLIQIDKAINMVEKSPVFEKIYREYLAQVAMIDFKSKTEKLGVQINGDEVIIPFFGRPHKVSANGIIDPYGNKPNHSVIVVICKYLLLCPDDYPKEDDWVSYKNFRDAAPFVGGFVNNVEAPIARNFACRLDELEQACKGLGGRPAGIELPYQLSIKFSPLPKVPILLLFNDEDDEFPAQCSVLFERRAENYLDMECLAIVGMLLSDYLKKVGEDLYT